MKRTDKVLVSGIAVGLVLVCVFATFYGVTNQRRNAARAKLGTPESMASRSPLGGEARAVTNGRERISTR